MLEALHQTEEHRIMRESFEVGHKSKRVRKRDVVVKKATAIRRSVSNASSRLSKFRFGRGSKKALARALSDVREGGEEEEGDGEGGRRPI